MRFCFAQTCELKRGWSQKMSFNKKTLKWLEKKSNINMLKLYRKRLNQLPEMARNALLEERLICVGTRTAQRRAPKVILTEKGQHLLKESKNKEN